MAKFAYPNGRFRELRRSARESSLMFIAEKLMISLMFLAYEIKMDLPVVPDH